MHRAPEATVPFKGRKQLKVICPENSRAGDITFVKHGSRDVQVLLPVDAVPGEQCMCKPCGYVAAPVDIYAIGACGLTLAFRTQQLPPVEDVMLFLKRSNNCYRREVPLSAKALHFLAS